jgi:hypothetical protein
MKGANMKKQDVVIWVVALAMLTFLMVVGAMIFLPKAHAQVIWQESFDSIKQGVCKIQDCSVNPGLPSGYGGWGADGGCGGTTTLGNGVFRIDMPRSCWPAGENYLSKSIPATNKFWLTWNGRDSHNSYGHFQKLFRFKQSSGQVLIPEYYQGQMNLWSTTGSNSFFPGWKVSEIVPGKWHKYEIYVDIPGKKADFYFDGMLRGSLANQNWGAWNITRVEIGGNQYQQPPNAWREYDNVSVSLTRMGDVPIPPPVCVPLPTQNRVTTCPTGQTGSIIEQRVSSCPGPTWGAWTVTSNTCVTPPIPPTVDCSVCTCEINTTFKVVPK